MERSLPKRKFPEFPIEIFRIFCKWKTPKLSYDSDYDSASDSVASENQPLVLTQPYLYLVSHTGRVKEKCVLTDLKAAV